MNNIPKVGIAAKVGDLLLLQRYARTNGLDKEWILLLALADTPFAVILERITCTVSSCPAITNTSPREVPETSH